MYNRTQLRYLAGLLSLALVLVTILTVLWIEPGGRVFAAALDVPDSEQSDKVIRTSSPRLGQILVKFRPGTSPAEQTSVLQRYQLQPGVQDSEPTITAAELQETDAVRALLSALNVEPSIEYAEPDYYYQAFDADLGASIYPNDTYYALQWALKQIRVPEAWATTTGKAEVVVAVIDTGVDLTHPDLAGNLVPGASFVRGFASPEDDSGHGSHIASIAAAISNNDIGVTGVGWATRVMPIKALNGNGSGRVSDIADGIRWAVDHGADIVNLSLGGTVSTWTLRAAIDYADRHGVLVVAAVGNDYSGDNEVNYPAAYDNVLAVAATDRSDNHADFSNSGDFVGVAAPGVDIFAATWRGSGYSYATYHGTSMATAFVSGVAALLLAIDSDLSPDEITTILAETAVDLMEPGRDALTGYGRIDAAAAVALVAERTGIEPTVPVAEPTPPQSSSPAAPSLPTQRYTLYLPVLQH